MLVRCDGPTELVIDGRPVRAEVTYTNETAEGRKLRLGGIGPKLTLHVKLNPAGFWASACRGDWGRREQRRALGSHLRWQYAADLAKPPVVYDRLVYTGA